MLQERHRQRLRSLGAEARETVVLGLHPATRPLAPGASSGSSRPSLGLAPEPASLQANLENLAAGIKALCGRSLEVVEAAPATSTVVPALSLKRAGAAGGARVFYSMYPAGPQMPPFLEHLEFLAGASTPGQGSQVRIRRPVELLLFAAEQCPHCSVTVRTALWLCRASPQVSLHVVDPVAFPDFAARYSIKSVPVLFLDDGLAIRGEVGRDAVLKELQARDEPAFPQSLLESFLEMGRLGRAAEFVMEPGNAPHVARAWESSTLSLRIAFMVLFEDLAAAGSLPHWLEGPLLNLLPSAGHSLRGDTADLLGLVGGRESEKALVELSGDTNPDVAEIAIDALLRLRQRLG